MIVKKNCLLHWKKGEKYYEKVICGKSGREIYSMLAQQTDNICEHYTGKRVQDAAYQKPIAELCEGEVIIHVDYSENFKNKQQNKIKAGYYDQGQFSLFTVVVYI